MTNAPGVRRPRVAGYRGSVPRKSRQTTRDAVSVERIRTRRRAASSNVFAWREREGQILSL